MMQSLEQFVCRIIDSEGKVRGTGFFIRPDGYVVTCYHVINHCKENIKVGVFSESEPISGEIVREYELNDIAVLKINREKCQVLPLSIEWEPGDQIFSHGFSIQHSLKQFPKGFPMNSVLSGKTTLEGEINLLVLENTEVDRGMSGAPAVNKRTGEIIGILKLKYEPGKNGNQKTLIIPTDSLFEKWPELMKYHDSIQYKNKMKLDLPNIQSVLRQGKTTKGNFFKPEPEWIDFEEGYIVEREEVNEIITNLENKKIQLILGSPASGKSVILKNVGFELTKNYTENTKVYMIELKKHSKDKIELYFDIILEICDENAIIIVDDAHLHPSECERLIKDFENRGKGKLIIGSRKTGRVIEGNVKESSIYEYLRESCIFIETESGTEKIIKSFFKKKHRKYNFSDKKICAISQNLEQYKNDLWFLSWALNVYNPEIDLVKKEDIYKNIRDLIREINVGDETKINGENVIFPLSIFYRFEIQIERAFLEEHLDIEKNIINQLIEQSEIIEYEDIGRNKMLSLNHSSIAELYYEVFLKYPSLGERVKKKVNQKDLTISLFRHYLKYQPTNYLDVIIYSDKNNILDILNDKDVFNAVHNLLMNESDIAKIALLTRELRFTSAKIAKDLVESLNVDKLKSMMENEPSIMKIANFVGDISNASRDVAYLLIDVVKLKIEREPNIEKIGICVRNISYDSSEVGKGLSDGGVTTVFSSDGTVEIFKHNKQSNIENGYSNTKIIFKSGEVGKKLVESLDMRSLKIKINKEPDIVKVGNVISDISFVSYKVGKNLVKSLKKDLRIKIEKEPDIEKIGEFVSDIVYSNYKIGKKLINIFKLKIENESDIEKVGSCLKHISYVNRSEGEMLVESLDLNELKIKIEKEPNIEKIDRFLGDISYVSHNVEEILVKYLNLDKLKIKIEREPDIKKIGYFIFNISLKDNDVGKVLVESLNMNELKMKIEIEQDIEKIGCFFRYFKIEDSHIQKMLIESLNKNELIIKIEREPDIKKIRQFFNDFSSVYRNIGRILIESLNKNELKTKIEREPDKREIKRFIIEISLLSSDVGNMLFKSLDLKLRLYLNKLDVIPPILSTTSENSLFLRDLLKKCR